MTPDAGLGSLNADVVEEKNAAKGESGPSCLALG